MISKQVLRRLFTALFIAALALGGLGTITAQAGQPQSLTGWFTILRGDGPDGSSQTSYLLVDSSGTSTRLLLDEGQGFNLLALDRQLVTVSGAAARLQVEGAESSAFQVDSIEQASVSDGIPPLGGGGGGGGVSGSQPFISIMCKFSDYAQEPKTLSYFQGMYGATFPGLNHYWREVSYNMIDVTGSNAVGWYTLPQPRSYYVYGGNLDFDRAAEDCTAVADPYVNFSGFVGINLMFNYDLDGYAWGGAHYLTLDGVSKVWPMTWEPPWGYSAITVISHEMGHAFGLPHSSGNYGETYDNRWDVMSDTWTDCGNSSDATYGCLGQHTIIYHKDRLGWVPSSMKYTLNSALPPTGIQGGGGGVYLMASLPFGGAGSFYTVEARYRPGYDVKLPGVGVIIHEVVPIRGIPAHVVDVDLNQDTGDAGAIWTVGETFTDAPNGISVSVLSATAQGFVVQLQNGASSATIQIDSNAQILPFGDVPLGYWAESWINTLYENGVTGGCSSAPLMFCPGLGVSRAQMAVFLLRAKYGSAYTPPSVGGSTGFNDVATDYWAAAWIKQLDAEGITGGCGEGNYCPELTVTRDQMAVFLLRTEHGSLYTPPAVGSSTGFTDVPVDYWAAAWIKQLAAEGITGGCTATAYCPTTPVTRDQMSVFLVGTFNLP